MTSKIVRENIAARLKKAREKAGYASAKDFCQKNLLTLESYLAHEKGEMPIKSLQAIRYSKLLNLSLAKLLIGN